LESEISGKAREDRTFFFLVSAVDAPVMHTVFTTLQHTSKKSSLSHLSDHSEVTTAAWHIQTFTHTNAPARIPTAAGAGK
jgi:hypothetical protein